MIDTKMTVAFVLIGLAGVAAGLFGLRLPPGDRIAAGLALVVGAGVLILRRRDWLRPLVTFVASAVLFQILTLGQPPLVVGAVFTILVTALLARDLFRQEPALAEGM